MRTTVSIDDDVLMAAKNLARRSGRSLGSVLSDLARESLAREPQPSSQRSGILLLPLTPDAPAPTLEDVNRLRDELP